MVTPGSDLKPPPKLRAARGDHVITALHTQYRIWILFLSQPYSFVRGRTIHDAEKLPQISHEKSRCTYILHCGIFIVAIFLRRAINRLCGHDLCAWPYARI